VQNTGFQFTANSSNNFKIPSGKNVQLLESKSKKKKLNSIQAVLNFTQFSPSLSTVKLILLSCLKVSAILSLLQLRPNYHFFLFDPAIAPFALQCSQNGLQKLIWLIYLKILVSLKKFI